MSNGALVLGITRRNVELMMEGKPLIVRHEEVGDTTGHIMMVYAENMQELQKHFDPMIDENTTIVDSAH